MGEEKRQAEGDDFKDILKLSETALRKVWDNEEDNIWNEYIKGPTLTKNNSSRKVYIVL